MFFSNKNNKQIVQLDKIKTDKENYAICFFHIETQAIYVFFIFQFQFFSRNSDFFLI